jgi:hypothetical protein
LKGQIYFAWIDEDEDFDDTVHNRFDEDVFSLSLSQSEGDFASLTLEIKNPRIGLLNVGRKVWCYIAINDGTDIVPLFKGRLIGVPTNVFDTLVQLEFTARPSDFVDQKTALANTMKVLPYYDSIFVSPDSWADPDVVLEAYSRLWHIDPVTHVVTTSDILVPEDGVEEVTEDQHFYDSMEVTLNSTPLRSVSMVATIPWTQSDLGAVDLTGRIKQLFSAADTSGLLGGIAQSFTMKGLISDWPKTGSEFGSGWKVSTGVLADVSATFPVKKIPDIFGYNGTIPIIPDGSIIFPLKVTGEWSSGVEKAGFNFTYDLVIAAVGYAAPTLSVSYEANREFAQLVTFTMRTAQQAIVTLPGDDESMVITLNANKVSDPTEDASVPIGDIRRRTYVHSNRGMQSVQHLLLVARAHLCARSRAVESKFEMDFLEGLRLRSLRKGGLLHDHRLPGGQASGKVIDYQFSLDGESGDAKAVIKIASSVGYGGSYSATAGDPVYVDDDYVEDDWQDRINVVRLTDTADVAYTMPESAFFDDNLDFEAGLTDRSAVITMSLLNSADSQRGAVAGFLHNPNVDQAAIDTILQAHPTQISVLMVPMEGGPFQQEVVISLSDLIVPQQINLEAPSNA